MNNCKGCVYFTPKQSNTNMGRCDYPIPEWIRISVSGGAFISNEEYSGQECAVYKCKLDVMEEPIKTNKPT